MNKIREALKPIYKQFVCEYLKTDPEQIGTVCYTKMRYWTFYYSFSLSNSYIIIVVSVKVGENNEYDIGYIMKHARRKIKNYITS